MQTAITLLRAQLAPLYPPGEANAIIRLLLEEVCGITRTQQLAHPDLQLPDHLRGRLQEMGQRLATGEPVQQVLGYEWFAGRQFEVTRDTLIPRPETAELVELILADIKAGKVLHAPAPRLLDVGTGTGCIALTLAAELPETVVTALDVSAGALSVARRNVDNLGLHNVNLLQADILQMADEEGATASGSLWTGTDSTSQLDLIVSNPPYIRRSEAADMERHVLDYEPHTALFVDDADPLLFYRAIARFGQKTLCCGGRLYFEINEAFGAETCRLLSDTGYTDVQLHTDAFGRDRMISCQK